MLEKNGLQDESARLNAAFKATNKDSSRAIHANQDTSPGRERSLADNELPSITSDEEEIEDEHMTEANLKRARDPSSSPMKSSNKTIALTIEVAPTNEPAPEIELPTPVLEIQAPPSPQDILDAQTQLIRNYETQLQHCIRRMEMMEEEHKRRLQEVEARYSAQIDNLTQMITNLSTTLSRTEAQPRQETPPIRETAPKPTTNDNPRSYAGTLKKGLQETNREEAKSNRQLLKKCLTPYIEPPPMAKLHFHWYSKVAADRKTAVKLAFQAFRAAGIKSVKDISFVGKSIIEIYVEEANKTKTIQAMRQWVGKDTFVPKDRLGKTALPTTTDATTIEKCQTRRAVYLCARNRGSSMQKCILQDIHPSLHQEILDRARALREEWTHKGQNESIDSEMIEATNETTGQSDNHNE